MAVSILGRSAGRRGRHVPAADSEVSVHRLLWMAKAWAVMRKFCIRDDIYVELCGGQDIQRAGVEFGNDFP